MSEIVLVRHGATAWSECGKHTGRTDLPLSAAGEHGAQALRPLLAGRAFGRVLVSPLQRAVRTAELAGITAYDVEPDLQEWDYGSLDGLTTEEISAERGRAWTIWDDGAASAGGESIESVATRAARVLARAAPALDAGQDVLLIGHGHALRVLAATWLGIDPRGGAMFALSAGSLSALGHERERPVLQHWNTSAVAQR